MDALDEFSDASNARHHLIAELRNLPKTRLLITSRQIPSIENQFKNDYRVEVRASDEDVRAFIESEIAHQYQLLELLGGQNHLRGILVESLVEETKGM